MTLIRKIVSFKSLRPASFNVDFVNSYPQYSCKPRLNPPWKVLFFGTDSFALHSLKALWAKYNTGTLLSDLAVVSKKGCLVRQFAESEGLTIYDWPIDTKNIESKYHIGMVVSFGNLLPEDVIKAFPLGCLNVHASLLPRWRGAAPIIHAVSNGDTETGISIMKIRPHKFDTGDIVRQYRISIDPNETSKKVEHKLGICGSNLLMECLRDLPRCLDMSVAQPKDGITHAPKVNSSMASIFWDKMTAFQVYNLHRALYHLYPLTTRWHGQLVKLQHISLDKVYTDNSNQNSSSSASEEETSKRSALDFLKSSPSSGNPKSIKTTVTTSADNSGSLVYDKQAKHLKVLCSDGSYVIVKKLTVSGKTMSASDFYNGFISKKSKELWKFDAGDVLVK